MVGVVVAPLRIVLWRLGFNTLNVNYTVFCVLINSGAVLRAIND